MMKKNLTDAERLKKLFEGKRKIDFVRATNFSGGASMVSQHISGHRPISITAASQYAQWLGVSVADISPTLAKEIEAISSSIKPDSSENISSGTRIANEPSVIHDPLIQSVIDLMMSTDLEGRVLLKAAVFKALNEYKYQQSALSKGAPSAMQISNMDTTGLLESKRVFTEKEQK